jgi:hypothetical protein
MSQDSKSAVSIELALRAARLAKASLELMSLSLPIAKLQLAEIVQEIVHQVREIDQFIERQIARGL